VGDRQVWACDSRNMAKRIRTSTIVVIIIIAVTIILIYLIQSINFNLIFDAVYKLLNIFL